MMNGQCRRISAVIVGFAAAGISAAAARDCADVLGPRTYACDIKQDSGNAFEDCFRFTSPGADGPVDLFSDVADATFACSCGATGTFRRPNFGEARAFTCVGATAAGTLLAIRGGRASGRGFLAQAVNDLGSGFVIRCRRSNRCSILVPQSGEGAATPPGYR